MNWFKKIFHRHLWLWLNETEYRPFYVIDGGQIKKWSVPGPLYCNKICVKCNKAINYATEAREADIRIEKIIKEKKEEWFKGLSMMIK